MIGVFSLRVGENL